MLTGQNTKANGFRTSNMAMARRLFVRIMPSSKAPIKMAESMAKASSNGQTALSMMETSMKTVYKARASTLGTTNGNILDSGSTTRCKAVAYLRGQMDESTKVSTKMTRKRAMVSLSNLMAADTKVSG